MCCDVCTNLLISYSYSNHMTLMSLSHASMLWQLSPKLSNENHIAMLLLSHASLVSHGWYSIAMMRLWTGTRISWRNFQILSNSCHPLESRTKVETSLPFTSQLVQRPRRRSTSNAKFMQVRNHYIILMNHIMYIVT